jgi:hypothetical protein
MLAMQSMISLIALISPKIFGGRRPEGRLLSFVPTAGWDARFTVPDENVLEKPQLGQPKPVILLGNPSITAASK